SNPEPNHSLENLPLKMSLPQQQHNMAYILLYCRRSHINLVSRSQKYILDISPRVAYTYFGDIFSRKRDGL
ncbi:MAG TPA: hypothetical protein VN729_10175, partial [Ktedonobacteraceae bacterium]|nr:hypothetical protein [Ktedonobacteraceae bacterium]